jgi:FtsP/CotA-like multicopper oxidase with cupredoxin domain
MVHHLSSVRAGLVTALLLLTPAFGGIIPRQYDASAPATIEATTTFSISVSSTPINEPTITYSSNATTTAAPSTATASSSSLPPKYYKLVFTKGWVDTNGNPREAILINGQTPGPLIEAEEGQELTVSILLDPKQTRSLTGNRDIDRSSQQA